MPRLPGTNELSSNVLPDLRRTASQTEDVRGVRLSAQVRRAVLRTVWGDGRRRRDWRDGSFSRCTSIWGGANRATGGSG